MNREDVIAILSRHRAELQGLGVRRAALFGSVATGKATAHSDIDIMIDLDETAQLGVFEYAGIVQFIEGLFPSPVDIANRAALKAHIRPRAEQDAIYAF